MKQTAVEWLIEQFYNNDIPFSSALFKKAKELERQQICNAFKNGRYSGQDNYGYGNDVTGKKYYKETFKNK